MCRSSTAMCATSATAHGGGTQQRHSASGTQQLLTGNAMMRWCGEESRTVVLARAEGGAGTAVGEVDRASGGVLAGVVVAAGAAVVVGRGRVGAAGRLTERVLHADNVTDQVPVSNNVHQTEVIRATGLGDGLYLLHGLRVPTGGVVPDRGYTRPRRSGPSGLRVFYICCMDYGCLA